MSWACGYVNGRDVGYAVPTLCDHPDCTKEIDRGLSYLCGEDIGGGELGCGLFFCTSHLKNIEDPNDVAAGVPEDDCNLVQLCDRCENRLSPYDAKPDITEWIKHKLTHKSWFNWRKDNPGEVRKLRSKLQAKGVL